MPASLPQILSDLLPAAEWRWDAREDGYYIADLVMLDGTTPPTEADLKAHRATAERRMADRDAKRKANRQIMEDDDLAAEITELVDAIHHDSAASESVKTKAGAIKGKIDGVRSLRTA